MDEHSLGSATFRADFYKVLSTVLHFPVPLQAVPGYGPLPQSAKERINDGLAHVRDVITLMAHPGHGEVNPVHRPVVEQLMTDLQALLDAMPAKEQPEQPNAWDLADESAREAGARKAKELATASKPEASFGTVQQATMHTKRLCREENISVVRVNSSYVMNGKVIQTIITTFDDTSDATYAKLVAILNEAGYTSIRVHTDTNFVSACSRLQSMFHMA